MGQAPPITLTAKQIVLSVLDIGLAALALFLLLPASVEISFLAFLGIFVLASLAGLISHVPGGVGVFRDPPLFLKPGDVMEAEIQGIGVLRNTLD